MATDIRTVDEIEVGPFTVRVGAQECYDCYDAAVVEHEPDDVLDAAVMSFGEAMGVDTSKVRDAPIVSHEKMYKAVGLAIQRYIEDQ